ncbi:DUF6884 domain-containing protein [Alkalicoccus urumqiensis]|uniref:DUF6884 domain-containing protein n=1 Tax=Alkalicoccus urumqiensis TaxID=1548213 RepID=A0A2P6MKY2_ALKUR|nr:DUF6884 domain-containing protein [Alkalicoccus urumqiensis]PRO66931.1 hypothetical protein C6I21_03135 [Alkalicoccus urumqiensis]
MRTLAVLPCGKQKIWKHHPESGPAFAAEAYTGTLHRYMQSYARFHADDFCILSALHGFLLPEDIVPEDYDRSFSQPPSETISTGELTRQFHEKGLDAFDRYMMMTGRKYEKVVKGIIPEERRTYPLEGLGGIGYILNYLKKEEADRY